MKLYVVAFLVDPTAGLEDSDAVLTALAEDFGENARDFIVWDSAEDFVSDHAKSGPIDVAYLCGEESD